MHMRHAGLALLGGVLTLLAAGGGARAESPMDTAQAFVAAHQKIPEFTPPGPAFDAKTCMAGKKILSVPLSMTIPYSVAVNNAMMEAARSVGTGFTTWSNQLKVDQWIQGLSLAVQQKYTLVSLLSGINPVVLAPQIAEARAAGVKVRTTDTYDITQTPPAIVDGSARSPHSVAAKLLADWAFVKTGGKPDVIIIGSDEIIATPAMVKAAQDELTALCPACKQRYLNVPVPEWGTKITPSVQAALVADPGINFVLPIYDSMAQFVIPALRLTGRMDTVKIAASDGTPFVIDLVRTGQVDMDVGSSVGWIGYAGLDAAMRMLCGMPAVDNLNTPLYLFTKENAATAGVPATYDDGYGNSHVAGFRKLWGVN
jgi:ribose transport system substrate-binding protein